MDLYSIANRFVLYSFFDDISSNRNYTDSVGYMALIDNSMKYSSKYSLYSGKYNRYISGVVELNLNTLTLNIINYGFKTYFKNDYIRNRQ